MAGGGVVALGIVMIIAGLVLPGVGAQQTIAGAGPYQVTQTVYPYAGLGAALVLLGIIVLFAGFLIVGLSAARKNRDEREQREERERLYELASRPTSPQLVVAPQYVPSSQATAVMSPAPPSAPSETMFCPACGKRANCRFCPDDGTEMKPLAGSAGQTPP